MSRYSTDRDYSSTNNSNYEKMTIVKVSGCSKLNVREEPSITSKIIEVLNRDDILEKFDYVEDNGFSKVRLISGKYGWAMTKYLTE